MFKENWKIQFLKASPKKTTKFTKNKVQVRLCHNRKEVNIFPFERRDIVVIKIEVKTYVIKTYFVFFFLVHN